MIENNVEIIEGKPIVTMPVKTEKKSSSLPLWIGVVIGVVVGVIAVLIYYFASSDVGYFEKEFPEVAHNSWSTLSSEGDCMTITLSGVTNTDYLYDFDAWEAIEEVCDKLELSDVPKEIKKDIKDLNKEYDDSGEFEYCDGTEENDDYVINWNYRSWGALTVVFVCK